MSSVVDPRGNADLSGAKPRYSCGVVNQALSPGATKVYIDVCLRRELSGGLRCEMHP